MATVNKSVSVPANGTVDNVLSGSAFEYLPGNAQLQFGIVQASGNVADVLATVQSGSDILAEEGPLIVRAGMPVNPDDFVLSDVALGGERLLIKLRNTTGAAITVNVTVVIDLLD